MTTFKRDLPIELESLCQKSASRWRDTFSRLGIEREDILQEARLRAYEAMNEYDPKRGARITTFVYLSIYGRLCALYRSATCQSKGRGRFLENIDELDPIHTPCCINEADDRIEAMKLCENDLIRILYENGCVVTDAAKIAGISRTHYYKLLRKFALNIRREAEC